VAHDRAGDEVPEAAPLLAASCCLGAADEGNPAPVDVVADEGQQRWEQRQRCGDRDDYDEDGAAREAVEIGRASCRERV